MDSLVQQIHTVSGLASSVSDDNARDELLMKHAQSVCSQLRNLLVTPQNAQTLVEAVKGAGMCNRHKDAILNAISERLAENLSKTSKQSRPNQAIEDVAPFLTASDVQFLEKAEYSLLARAQRVADVYARIFCWNPNEPSCGKAIHLLQQHFACPDLANPQVFYNSLQDFKARLKTVTSNKTPPTTRVANFTVPDALPADIYDMAFKNEPPVGLTRSTSVAGMGPLRKSDKRLQQAAGPSPAAQQFMQAFSSNPFAMNMSQMLQAFGHGSQHSGMDAHYVPRGRKQLALCNEPWPENQAAEARAPQSNPPTHAVGTPESTPARSHTAISVETPSPNQQSPAGGEPPLSPKEQAQAMLKAWTAGTAEEPDQQEDGDDQEPQKKPAALKSILKTGKGRGKSKSKGKSKGRGRGKGRGKGKATAMKTMKLLSKKVMKAVPTAKAMKVEKKAMGKTKTDNKGKETFSRAMIKKMTVKERIRLRPDGCYKCRFKPGCCPSCFAAA